ncbi:MAG: Dyp-type peroxidase [Myxococcota bacterium]
MSEPLELDEIQGLILSGYGERPVARYALFEVTDAKLAKAWIKALLPDLQFSEYRRSRRNQPPYLKPICVNIAFTHLGLTALGLPTTTLCGFSLPFQEGMHEPSRARRLGDDGDSAPERWRWGGPSRPVHGVLAVFAGSEDADPEEWQQVGDFLDRHCVTGNGIRTIEVLDTMPANRLLRKEHFGFRDGIANPRLSGIARPGSSDVIASGEVILGYQNEYAKYPMSPVVPDGVGPSQVLPQAQGRDSFRDFGRNGSYLVFRQLSQDVKRFWEYLDSARRGVLDAPPGLAGAEWLGAKMVGRWRNGTPLTRYPEHPGPESHQDDNEFLFGEHDDAFGTRCPIGSHIRRTNPRDTALPIPHDPELSGTPENERVRKERLALSNKHRLLRRGRAYGEPLDPTYEPEAILRTNDESERGLHFLCFNANLGRQFEFVQSNWSQNPAFAGLSSDPDPITSSQRKFPFKASTFTIQGCPTRRVHDVPRVVETRGGAYFFMPSRSGLRYLSEM